MKENSKFIKNQKGQGVMEYIILTGLIGIFCLATVKKIGSTLNTKFEQIENRIDRKVKINR